MILRSLLLGLCVSLPLFAESLPDLPVSGRVLTEAEVKNFWLNTIRQRPVPPTPSRLYPELRQRRQNLIDSRLGLMNEIRGGSHDVNARLVCLEHNVAAWKAQGNPDKAWETERELLLLREHLARLATLQAQKESAEKISATADEVASLRAEIDQLRSQLSSMPSY